MLVEATSNIALINLLCVVWFLVAWVGYSYFAKTMAKRTMSLSSVLHIHREDWMRSLLQRDMRVSDAALVANLERHVTFFASTTILILAGLLAVIPNIGLLHKLLSGLPIIEQVSEAELQLRIVLLVCVFVYAFFTFTWSMRQYGFCSILVGAAPLPDDKSETAITRETYARHAAKVIDQAGHSYNYGLRAYYFAMSVLAWFIHPWLFIGAVTLVVAILYRREFYSKPVKAMIEIAKHKVEN
ncbi:DUF599 domain-containing protein [Maricurvus nonylphenolicus]|uniref:DUF599 domain-containing protein n=1 Tax=Maricurvus nonylphenolicus TaxID=1008307 RepID=UPI0036F35928